MRSIGLSLIFLISFTESLCNTSFPVENIAVTSRGCAQYDIDFPDFTATGIKNEWGLLSSFEMPTSYKGENDGFLSSPTPASHCGTVGRSIGAYSGFIVSAGLITYGVVAQGNPLLQKINVDADASARRIFPGRMHADDYLQYVPIAAYSALDFTGVKAKHNFLERTVVAATSYIFMAAIVNVMKFTIPVLRPDGSAWNSFPSGHTATAFTGAHLLFREYKETSPWIGIAGYATATTIGVMRMLNKRHWLSDVAAGAGIGILSVELSYLFLPVFDRWVYGKGKKEKSAAMTLAPMVGDGWYGASFACVF